MDRNNKFKVMVRPARKEDCREIMKLIKELAEFEKMPDGVKTTAEILEKDGYEDPVPAFLAYIAEDKNKPGEAIGYAICYVSYDGFRGKAFFIEDIMVTEAHRGKGVGTLLFQFLCREALAKECEIVRFYVLDWNPANNFYAKMGAVDATKAEGWHWHIMYKQEMEKVAQMQL